MIDHNIKLKTGIAGLLLLLLSARAEAQFSAGSMFYVAPGTQLVIDSFTLQPLVVGADLSNNTLTVSHVAVPPAGSGSGSISRVYQFNPGISFRGTTGLYYLNSELNGNTAGLLSFVYQSGSAAFTANAVTTTGNTNNYVAASTGTNTVVLSKITSVNAGVPLPLDLLAFTAKESGSRTLIEWTTAQELNCDHFDVERSADGRSFQFLVNEKAVGNSHAEQHYQIYDEQPLNGWNYYRLKQVDIDGKFTWSPIAAVFFGDHKGTSVSVYPNPVQNKLTILLNSEKDQSSPLLLMDATGRILKSQKLQLVKGDNSFNLDMQDIAAGSYLLKINNTFQTKVIKEK